MKNLKNTIAAVGLMAVLGMGTATVNAGIIISDRAAPAPNTTQCNSSGTSFTAAIKGILVVGMNGFLLSDGMILSDGLILSDRTCRDGIIISDRSTNGIIISD